MPITIHCSSCKATLRVRDELGGRKVKCPKCSSTIEVALAPPPDAEEGIQAVPPPVRAGADKGVRMGKPPSRRPTEDPDETEADESRPPQPALDDGDEDDEDFDERPRKKKKKKKMNRADLRAIATYQKAVLVCILVYIIAVIAQFAFPPALRLFLGIGLLGVLVTAAVFAFLLATKVYSTGMGIAMGILTLIPFLGFITLLIVNAKATSTLNLNGVRVGLLGAKMSDLD